MLGSCTKSFGGISIAETAEIFVKSGLDCAELCFCQQELPGWKYNFCGYEQLPKSSEVAAAVEVFRSNGIKVVAIGVYNCLWQGSFKEHTESLRYFREYCDIAAENHIDTITTHTGTVLNTVNSQRNAPDIKRKASEAFIPALTEAAKRGLTVAVECSPFDAFRNYADFSELKKYINSTLGTNNMLKYIGVPASDDINIDNSDIALYHLKDKKKSGIFYECFGDGDTDFSVFFESVKASPHIPVILEHVNSGNLAETVKRYTVQMQKAVQSQS